MRTSELSNGQWQVDKSARWGDLESEEEEESSEEEEEEEEDEDAVAVDTESLADGLTSVVSGYSSLPSGIETPEALDLRKSKAVGAQLILDAHMHCTCSSAVISIMAAAVNFHGRQLKAENG